MSIDLNITEPSENIFIQSFKSNPEVAHRSRNM